MVMFLDSEDDFQEERNVIHKEQSSLWISHSPRQTNSVEV